MKEEAELFIRKLLGKNIESNQHIENIHLTAQEWMQAMVDYDNRYSSQKEKFFSVANVRAIFNAIDKDITFSKAVEILNSIAEKKASQRLEENERLLVATIKERNKWVEKYQEKESQFKEAGDIINGLVSTLKVAESESKIGYKSEIKVGEDFLTKLKDQ